MPTGGYRDPVIADQGNPRGPDRALRLRPLRPDDEAAFLAGHAAMAAEGLSFGLGLEPGMRWSAYLETLAGHQAGVGLPAGWVPSTFLVAEVAGEIVGRSSIRHALTDYLQREGGHIGYSVLPVHRPFAATCAKFCAPVRFCNGTLIHHFDESRQSPLVFSERRLTARSASLFTEEGPARGSTAVSRV